MKNSSFHVCVDYRALNKLTSPNHYPPRIDDLWEKVKSATWFKKLDLKNDHNLLQVTDHNRDESKTAFQAKQELYERMVIPFDLMHAPARSPEMIGR